MIFFTFFSSQFIGQKNGSGLTRTQHTQSRIKGSQSILRLLSAIWPMQCKDNRYL